MLPNDGCSDGTWKRRQRGRSGADGRAKGLGVVQQPSVRVTGVTAEHLRTPQPADGWAELDGEVEAEVRWWPPQLVRSSGRFASPSECSAKRSRTPPGDGESPAVPALEE